MKLPRAGREYITGTVTGLPEGAPVEVSTDGTTWLPGERDGDQVRVLVAGPDVTGNPAGTLSLALGRTLLQVRAIENPEIIIRSWGAVDVA